MVARRFRTQAWKKEHITFGRARHGIEMSINLVPKVFGLCAAKTGTKKDESVHARENGYEGVWRNVKTNLNPRRGEGPCQECGRMAN